MNKVYEFLNKEKFNNVLEIGFGAGQLMSKIIKKKKLIIMVLRFQSHY